MSYIIQKMKKSLMENFIFCAVLDVLLPKWTDIKILK